MKTTQLYVKTKNDLAKARNEEKRRKNNVFLIVLSIALFVASFSSLWIMIGTIIYYVVIIIFWDNRPWIKIVTYQNIGDIEIQYELDTQLTNKEKKLKELSLRTSDLWDDLAPDQVVCGRKTILTLDKEIVSIYEDIFEINQTLEIDNDPNHIEDLRKTKEEIVLVTEFIRQNS